jgi:hypothetical protein
MKRIIRLTESDLTRLVRRVVKESRLLNEGVGTTAAKSFIHALEKTILGVNVDDDEPAALAAVLTMKSRDDLKEFSTEITNHSGKGWCAYFNSEMSDVDSEYDMINAYIVGLGGSNCATSSILGSIKKGSQEIIRRGITVPYPEKWNILNIPD